MNGQWSQVFIVLEVRLGPVTSMNINFDVFWHIGEVWSTIDVLRECHTEMPLKIVQDTAAKPAASAAASSMLAGLHAERPEFGCVSFNRGCDNHKCFWLYKFVVNFTCFPSNETLATDVSWEHGVAFHWSVLLQLEVATATGSSCRANKRVAKSAERNSEAEKSEAPHGDVGQQKG